MRKLVIHILSIVFGIFYFKERCNRLSMLWFICLYKKINNIKKFYEFYLYVDIQFCLLRNIMIHLFLKIVYNTDSFKII